MVSGKLVVLLRFIRVLQTTNKCESLKLFRRKYFLRIVEDMGGINLDLQ